jgi:RNA polymerase sigma-70 factor (ECF subfamily)
MREHIEACPACVAFLQNLRMAIDRCRSLEIPCDPSVSVRLRLIITKEYQRLLGMTSTERPSAGH